MSADPTAASYIVTVDPDDQRTIKPVHNTAGAEQQTSPTAEDALKQEPTSEREAEEPAHTRTEVIVLIFWSVVIVAGTVLGIVYFVVKTNKSECANGTALPGDVTAPDSPSFGEVLAVIWSFLPYACGLGLVVEVFRRRTMWPLLMLLMAGMIVVVNEGFFKRVISQDRPSGSCLSSKGMPSSHAELSIGFWWYFHLECFFKRHLTSTHAWTGKDKMTVMIAVYVLLLPVPFTRVVLHDHSWAQVGVGALVGAVIGTIWFVALWKWLYQHLDRLADLTGRCKCCWGEGLFHHFTNDFFPVPDESHLSDDQIKLREALFVGVPIADGSAADEPRDGSASSELPSMGSADAQEESKNGQPL
eukprot:TRINITY_DN6556_c0_g2_i1.p1 TRINITY_DN6556_c0_g2~~TRINITY_DN6556_c0_g2_i1.p1  ORF type:complete len:359 (+),score=61.24 TRINITY_DN6556_c0_g2_i1:181-1257(+)